MMKEYRSRVSLLIVALLYLGCLAQMLLTYLNGSFKLGLSLTLVIFVSLLVVLFTYSIKYVIHGTRLEIYSLGLLMADIDIHSITGFEENHNIISAPAASLKRLWVNFGKGERINISPRNQEEFIADIEAIRNDK